MILKKLKLNNFLAHENTEIEFAENGITVFIGDNGAGKSSILEAINFALYGDASKGNIPDLVRWTAKKAVVELIFSKGSDEYKVYREINLRGKSYSTVSKVEKKEKGSFRLYYSKNINKELPKLTGLSKKTFTASVLVKQGDIEGLIDLKPSDREKVLKQLLDMEFYQLLSDNYAKLRKEVEKEISTIISSLPDKENILREINGLEKEKNEIEKQKKELEKQKEELNEHLKEKKQYIYQLQKEKEKSIKITQQIKSLEEKLDSINKRLNELKEKLKDIEEKEKKLPQLKEKNDLFNEKQNLLMKVLEANTLKEKLKNLIEKEKDIKQKKSFVESYKQTAEKYENFKERYKNLNDEIKELSLKKGQLTQLNSQLQELKKDLKESMEKALEIAKKLTAVKRIFKTLELNPVIVETMLKDEEYLLKQYQQQREELRGEYKSTENQIKQLKEQLKNIENLKGECPTCLRPLEEHSKEKLQKELKEKISQLKEKLENIKIKGIEIKERLEKTEKSLKFLEEFKKWYEKHKEAKAKRQEIEAKIKVLQIKLEKIKDLEKEKEEIEKFLTAEEKNYHKYLEYKEFLQTEDENSLTKQIENIKEKLVSIPDIDEKHLKEKINQLKGFADKYKEVLNEIKQKENIIEEIKQLENEEKLIEENIEKLKQNLQNLDEIDKKIKDTQEDAEKLESNLNEILKEYTPIVSTYGQIIGKIENLQSQIKFIEEKEKEIEEKRKKLKKYSKLEEVFGSKGIQKFIKENALYKLPLITETLFKAFGFDFSRVKFSDNFDISLQVPTYEMTDRFINVKALSGGQRVALGLALRLALSHFLGTKSQFLILDEPTIHLDTQRKEELINILLKLKEKDFIKQLIVVTHDREIEDVADQIYYVEKGKVRNIA